MESFHQFFTGELAKKLFAVFLLIVLFYSIKGMITLILLTFVFSFLFYKSVNFACRYIQKVIPVKKKVIIIFLYTLLLIGISYLFYNYIPVVIRQLYIIKNQLNDFNINDYKGIFDNQLIALIKQTKLSTYLSNSGGIILKWVIKIEQLSIDIILAFVLSLLFIIEQDEIIHFARKIEKSRMSYYYNYYKFLGKKFLSSFGKIMEIQAILSIINAVFASIGFYFCGFDNVLGLGSMLFILGLIPIAGIIIALIPLVIIAYTFGGITKVVDALIILGILHLFEGYILKPKLMSVSVHLPVFLVFVILIFSEHYMGVWGLIIGIPLFVFMLDIMDVPEK